MTFPSNKIVKFSNMREFNDKFVTVCFKLSLDFANDVDDSLAPQRLYQIVDLKSLCSNDEAYKKFSFMKIIHSRKISPNL